MRMFYLIMFIFIVLINISCSSIRMVRPLQVSEQRINLSMGGPMIDNMGFPMPLPVISMDYQYGLFTNITIGGAFHITPAVFNIFGMFEVDSAFGLLEQSGFIPSLTGQLNFILMSDLKTSFYIFPQVVIIPSWRINDYFMLYCGVSSIIILYPKTQGLGNNWFAFSFPVGLQLDLGNFAINAECGISSPFSNNKNLVLSYIGFGDYGALAPYISLSYRFGR